MNRPSPTLQSSPAPWAVLTCAAALLAAGCSKPNPGASVKPEVIQNIGSDTMVNLAQAWAEAYQGIAPDVSVEVSGGGSGLGIAALMNGTADIANSSRHIEPSEEAKIVERTGVKPREFLVGFDALSIFVHKDNPIREISMEELHDIYAEGSALDRWSQLGVTNIPNARTDRIIRVSRQNNSGTYHYFRDTVCGKKTDFKLGSLDMNGSKDVVELVSRTPGAIGYSGLGYKTPNVKMIPVAPRRGARAILPSIATTLDKSYPISRPMFMYTPSAPPPHVQRFLDWVLSPAGQKIVEDTGYIPMPPPQAQP
ncbi:MAG TPA: phosphate ABC transporter substrate-binding protein [Verrucomicrobiota bacterium]|nr:phosphate ABC transporter substrate-binding protein [Verrucomicrobiota bacterium]